MAKKLPNKNPPKNIHIKINIYQKKKKKHLTKKSFVQKKNIHPKKTIVQLKHSSQKFVQKIHPKKFVQKNGPNSSKKFVKTICQKNLSKKFVKKICQNNLSKKCIKQIRPEKFIKKICQTNSWKEFVKKMLVHIIGINTHTKEISRFLHFCQWPPLFGKSITNKQISVLRSYDRPQADSKPENIKSTW